MPKLALQAGQIRGIESTSWWTMQSCYVCVCVVYFFFLGEWSVVKACRFSSLYDGSLSKKPLGLGLERHSTTKRQEIVRVSKMKKRNPGFAGKSSPLKKNGNCFVFFGKIGGGFQSVQAERERNSPHLKTITKQRTKHKTTC